MGAKYMTMLVKANIVSARDSKKRSMGARLVWERRPRARPNRMAKTATCRIWFSATDLARFSGNTWSRKSSQRSGGAVGTAGEAAGAGAVTPTPARLILVAGRPMTIATVVTISK